jgi:hypothetical protein
VEQLKVRLQAVRDEEEQLARAAAEREERWRLRQEEKDSQEEEARLRGEVQTQREAIDALIARAVSDVYDSAEGRLRIVQIIDAMPRYRLADSPLGALAGGQHRYVSYCFEASSTFRLTTLPAQPSASHLRLTVSLPDTALARPKSPPRTFSGQRRCLRRYGPCNSLSVIVHIA